MKKLILLTISALTLSACTLPFIGAKKAALQISSTPDGSISLNNNDVGRTPYFDDKLKPGDYIVKIQVPDQPNQSWTVNVTLAANIITVINRNFGPSEEESSNFLLQQEPLSAKDKTEISIITVPDNVIVKVDGQPQGFSPVSLTTLTAGDHNITLTAPGYQEQTIPAKIKSGYKLVISADLARLTALSFPDSDAASVSGALQSDDDIATSSAKVIPTKSPKTTPTPTPKSTTLTPKPAIATSSANLERPYVLIIETGTGWLRVRSEPNASLDNEVARVDVGKQYPFVEANDTGWYKIEYSSGQEGWITSRYAQLFR